MARFDGVMEVGEGLGVGSRVSNMWVGHGSPAHWNKQYDIAGERQPWQIRALLLWKLSSVWSLANSVM